MCLMSQILSFVRPSMKSLVNFVLGIKVTQNLGLFGHFLEVELKHSSKSSLSLSSNLR